jgi:hypothetical protein
MRQETASIGRRTVGYVKDLWAELDYAQRRLLEIQTGMPIQRERARVQAEIDELEALYALESPRQAD